MCGNLIYDRAGLLKWWGKMSCLVEEKRRPDYPSVTNKTESILSRTMPPNKFQREC